MHSLIIKYIVNTTIVPLLLLNYIKITYLYNYISILKINIIMILTLEFREKKIKNYLTIAWIYVTF